MQLVRGPWSWHAAHEEMSRRAAGPWNCAERGSDQPAGWGLRVFGDWGVNPCAAWQSVQKLVPWQRAQLAGSKRASEACRDTKSLRWMKSESTRSVYFNSTLNGAVRAWQSEQKVCSWHSAQVAVE